MVTWRGLSPLPALVAVGEALPVVRLRPGSLSSPWVGIAFVLCVFVGLMAGLRAYQRLANPHPEWVRKLFHVGMGLVTLCFPWLFASTWPVVLLAWLAITGLLALKLVRGLKCGIGNVVSGVERGSWGEFYFPLAVAILFVLIHREAASADRQMLLYVIPLLVLTLADSLAALVGVFYGQRHFRTQDGRKSIEGSLTFFLAAFLCVQTPLLLCGELGRLETLLIAALLALLATMFEAIAWHGLDNLLLPLIGYYLLDSYLDMKPWELGVRLAAMISLLGFVIVFRKRTTLAGGGLLAAALFGYVAWSLGDWPWLLPPLVVFVTYTSLTPQKERDRQRAHNVQVVLCVCSSGLFWLFVSRTLGRPELVVPYTVSFAAQLALICIGRRKNASSPWPVPALIAICAVEGWLVVFLPFLLLQRGTLFAFKCAGLALVGSALAATISCLPWPRRDQTQGAEPVATDLMGWLKHAVYAGVASIVGLLPCYAI